MQAHACVRVHEYMNMYIYIYICVYIYIYICGNIMSANTHKLL